MPGKVTVGVDGSPNSKVALSWAVDYALQAGADLQLVIAWRLPPYVAEPGPFPVDLEQGARQCIEDEATRVRDEHPELSVSTLVGEGPAASVLLEQAREASLLVVGSRGHGAFTGMLLGSVSAHCIHHAPCPVVVVPERRAPERKA